MPKRAAKRLTRATLNKLAPRADRYDVLCSAVEGFGVRINPSGTRAAFLRYWRDGKYWRLPLGRLGDTYTLDCARTDAMDHRAAVDRGEHPARERQQGRDAPSFAKVAERYMEEIAKPYRKASTVRGYEAILRKHLRPALGHMRIGEIQRDDVQRLHQRIGASAPGAANRALALVSVIMTNAERWGYRDARANPCHRMPKFGERKMERFLSADERARLDAVLATGATFPPGHPRYLGPATILATRLLLMTGARLGEIIGLRWSMVDLERACLRLPDSKTGAKVIPVSPQVVALLAKAAEGKPSGDAFVCPAQGETKSEGNGEPKSESNGVPKNESKPLQNFRRSWRVIRERAGLDDVRLHDLRHSAASDMLADGMSLPEIAIVLGHKSTQTTARYGHFADGTRRNIAKRMGDAIERSTSEGTERLRQRAVGADGGERSGGGETSEGGANVIPLRPRGKR